MNTQTMANLESQWLVKRDTNNKWKKKKINKEELFKNFIKRLNK